MVLEQASCIALCIENTKEADFHKCGQGQWEETTIGGEHASVRFVFLSASLWVAPGERSEVHFGSVQCSKGKYFLITEDTAF